MENTERNRRFWVGVASREHVQLGLSGGFAQFSHGKPGPAKRPRQGDGILYYSAKERFGEPEPCRRFTALGTVADDQPVQVEQFPGFRPWRRQIDWRPIREVEIAGLVPKLSFITNKARWAAPFRFGFFEIPEADFQLIADAMEAHA